MSCKCGKPIRANNMCSSCNGKEYYKKNKAKILARKQKHYIENKESIIVRVKQWKKDNSERVKQIDENRDKDKLRQYYKDRYWTDLDYRLKVIIRNRLRDALKHNFKSGRTLDLLGCSVEEFKKHMESLWQPGMTWDNHSLSGWHIDHVQPLNSFDLSNPEELKKACHYSNMQPLWASDNLQKKDKTV